MALKILYVIIIYFVGHGFLQNIKVEIVSIIHMDVILGVVELRFGIDLPTSPVEWLTDNGSCDRANIFMTEIRIGYAWCSTDLQDLAAQQEVLISLGVTPDRI